MKNYGSTGGFFAILLAAVLANLQAGALPVATDMDVPETSIDLAGALAPAGTADFSVLWLESIPRHSRDDSAPSVTRAPRTPAHEMRAISLPVPTPDIFRVVHDLRSLSVAPDGPTGRIGRISESASTASTEDWLLELQFASASAEQESGPAPFVPIPEPATITVVGLGLAGLALRKRRG